MFYLKWHTLKKMHNNNNIKRAFLKGSIEGELVLCILKRNSQSSGEKTGL